MLATNSKISTHVSRCGGTVGTRQWQSLTVVYETCGQGQPVLLLPAFSTVSSRAEMEPLATQLAAHFQVTVLDWPGFGDSDRPPLDYCPELYHPFLADFVRSHFTAPIIVIAAGHAAGYALQLAATHPQTCSKLVLVAPTWRGPLAVMGVPPAIRKGVKALVRSPLLGQALYGLNTRPSFLKWMYRRHVFVDDSQLTPAYLEQRYQNTQKPGGRYAPAAFVTGSLDPVQTRAEFLAYLEKLTLPLMVVVAEQAPTASKAEMEAIAALAPVQVGRLPGTLGMAEEYGNEVAEQILPFLQGVAD
ncbi:alpha/beta fold hydrolase [Almyronema epifaneia]|uniref:Alpha/beta fold hydrolase n=1 Tax=Almyronema epifaneia S1 TaxID=2991925 RepID=A0ABW6IFK9_9CYAN